MEEALIAYEDAVLRLVDEHDGKVVHRARTNGADCRPLEIQLFEWASQQAMDGYMADPRRTALSADREKAIARTEIVPVQLSWLERLRRDASAMVGRVASELTMLRRKLASVSPCWAPVYAPEPGPNFALVDVDGRKAVNASEEQEWWWTR
jgi:hypothetical protein